MANYYATTRTNYFRVKDADAFEAWCADLNLEFWKQDTGPNAYYACTADTGDCCGWPSQRRMTDEDGCEDYVDIDFTGELAEHVHERDCAVLIEIGSEKLRYLVGVAIAVHPDGRLHSLNIADIYECARQAFPGINVTEAQY